MNNNDKSLKAADLKIINTLINQAIEKKVLSKLNELTNEVNNLKKEIVEINEELEKVSACPSIKKELDEE